MARRASELGGMTRADFGLRVALHLIEQFMGKASTNLAARF
jgi:hypothetical protein